MKKYILLGICLVGFCIGAIAASYSNKAIDQNGSGISYAEVYCNGVLAATASWWGNFTVTFNIVGAYQLTFTKKGYTTKYKTVNITDLGFNITDSNPIVMPTVP